MARFFRIYFFVFIVIGATSAECFAQADNKESPLSYFLEGLSTHRLNMTMPPATDLLIARVRVLSIYWRGGRHLSPWPAGPKTSLEAKVEIVEVLRGVRNRGSELHVTFAERGPHLVSKFKYPATPQMRSREYIIASYLSDDAERRLIGFPISRREYENWENERWAYERERNRPGHRDK